MKSETEILGALDALLAQLPDDAARERAFAWLRDKHKAKPRSAVTQPETPVTVPGMPPYIGNVPQPHVPPHPDLSPPIWYGKLPAPPFKVDWTVNPHGGMCACPQCVPSVTCDNVITIKASNDPGFGAGPVFFTKNAHNAGCAPNNYPDWTWVGDSYYPPRPNQTVNMGGPNAYPSSVHVGSGTH